MLGAQRSSGTFCHRVESYVHLLRSWEEHEEINMPPSQINTLLGLAVGVGCAMGH